MNRLSKITNIAGLRERAEQLAQLTEAQLRDTESEDVKHLLHELTVHQIELEMQNDELRYTQQKAEFTRDQFAQLFNLSPIGYLTLNDKGMIRQCNQAMTELTGFSEDELRNRTLAEHVDPRDRVVFHVLLKATILNPEKKHFECRLLHKSNRDLFVRISARVLNVAPETNPSDVNLLLALTNISDIKEAEDKLKLSAIVYKAIGEAIMVASPDNRIMAVNPAFTKLTGYSEREAIGQPTTLLKSGRHDPVFYQNMWLALEQTGHWQGEIWNRRKSGEIYLEWLVINSIYNEQGEVLQRVAMFSDITDKKQAEQTIWQQANFDTLTNLPNRRMINNRLEQEIMKAQRNHHPLALLFIDLDHFKEINDTLGHGTGDLLLQEAAIRLSRCVRKYDTVGRLGGDEFTIILCELDDMTCVERIAQKILQQLSEPFKLENETLYVSASIGITFYPNDATEIDDLFKNADQAMYASKDLGRNCFCYFTPSMQETAQARMRLINDLRCAVVEQQFYVYYQPIVDLATGHVNKAEALIRWQHPERGFVSPGEFIPIAEETGLIIDIGNWVFFQAAVKAKDWQEKFSPNFQISINKSPVQFREGGASCSEWFNQLRDLNLDGHSIVIEITEGLLLNVDTNVGEKLLRFSREGIQVAIDDFGTGYSSLSYIKKFDIDFLKIDRSFVCNLTSDNSDMALCEAIIPMAHKLGMKVIAEGIETKEQCKLLALAGCDYGQGYLFAHPMSANDFETVLAQTDYSQFCRN